MRALAFLQNQWVRNPERVRSYIEKDGERYRRHFVSYALFAGCLTGRRIKAAFGGRIDNIAWDNISPQIGGRSSSVFPPDPQHIRRQIAYHQPAFLLAFGAVARNALENHPTNLPIIHGPHPAARGPHVMDGLRAMAAEYDGMVAALSAKGGGA